MPTLRTEVVVHVSGVDMARMAEWSKAADLRSVIVRCVGSNPTPRNKETSTLKAIYASRVSLQHKVK